MGRSTWEKGMGKVPGERRQGALARQLATNLLHSHPAALCIASLLVRASCRGRHDA